MMTVCLTSTQQSTWLFVGDTFARGFANSRAGAYNKLRQFSRYHWKCGVNRRWNSIWVILTPSPVGERCIVRVLLQTVSPHMTTLKHMIYKKNLHDEVVLKIKICDYINKSVLLDMLL